jgi:sulfotransferase family protein
VWLGRMTNSSITTRRGREWVDIPPVFIVGHGRSGTTLLRMMLSANRRIFISSEGAYVCPLRCGISTYGDLRDTRNLERLQIALLPWLEAVNYLSPPGIEDLAAWVDRFGCDERALITFYGTWEARVLGKDDLEWWGDNEPSHVFNIPYFARLFPSCKFILMIRDPRDVYASYKAAWPGYHTAESLAMLWERCLLDGLLAASCLGDSTVKQVRYENLVTNPRAQLQEVCEFLHVEYADTMLKFYESKAAKHLSQVSHHKSVVKAVFTESVGKHRQILTQEEIVAIEQRLYTPMRCLKYISNEEYEKISWTS